MTNRNSILTFSLIEKTRSILYIILLIIWNIGIFFGILAIFFHGDFKFNIFGCTFLIAAVIWVIGILFVKRFKVVGNIEISADTIKVTKEWDIIYIDVIRTNGLILMYYGAKDESVGMWVGLLRIKDGSGNFVSFEYEGKSYKFEFLVTKQSFLFSVYWILRAWKDNNVDFKILDQYKKDITNKELKEGWH